MEFGIVEKSELNNIDFSLPPDGDYTNAIMRDGIKAAAPDLRIGLARWGRKEWVGRLYADRTKEGDFLHHYAKNFNTIELNAVFYSIPRADLISKWKRMIDEAHQHDFLFLPKMSRVISHIKRLRNVDEETSQFLNNISSFGEHLGPILIQLGDNFPPKNLADLSRYVKGLPTDHKFFIELRHEEWFSDPSNLKAAFDLFKDRHIGTVITDAHGRRDCLHMELTIPEAYIRFNGTDGQNRTIDFSRIDDWSQRIKAWVDRGCRNYTSLFPSKMIQLHRNLYNMPFSILMRY